MGQQTLTTMMSMLQSEIATVQQISQTLGSGIEGYWSSGLEGGSFSAYFSGAGGKKGGSSGGGGVSIGGGGSSGGGGSYTTKDFMEDLTGTTGYQDDDYDISGWYNEGVDYSDAYHRAEAAGASDSVLQQIEDLRDQKVEEVYGGKDPNPDWKTNPSYANGIENGPVTYTGLAMLHGTPSTPEFVLNSD